MLASKPRAWLWSEQMACMVQCHHAVSFSLLYAKIGPVVEETRRYNCYGLSC